MNEFWYAAVPLLLFIGAGLAGMRIRLELKEHHKNTETTDLLRLTVTMLFTFAAIVLGLLITSSKATFDTAAAAVNSYAAALMELDESLHDAGPVTAPIRDVLVQYTAGMIASTWPTEAPPSGVSYPQHIGASDNGIIMESRKLGEMLREVNEGILNMPAATQPALEKQQECLAFMEIVWQKRWALIDASALSISTPFFVMLVFWLVIVFLCLGLSTPFNAISGITLVLGAIALASALLVIVDLNGLYKGTFIVSSAPMRGVLTQMLQN